jgi:hypothetical protein
MVSDSIVAQRGCGRSRTDVPVERLRQSVAVKAGCSCGASAG